MPKKSTTKSLIVGEAPARGFEVPKPFQGPSGDRLRRLAGVESLEDHFYLWNLRGTPMEKGERFDWRQYRGVAVRHKNSIQTHRFPYVLMMGRNVQRAYFGSRPEWEYLELRSGRYTNWVLFPHPSGLNHWWNDPHNVETAQNFLRSLGSA